MSVVIEQPQTPSQAGNHDLSVADAIWVVAALLQRGSVQQGQADILGPHATGTDHVMALLVTRMSLTKATSQSILQHIRQHCVANKEPKPNRSCVLFMTEPGNFRLYRASDPRHPGREGAPSHPKWENLPDEFHDLREWYETVWNSPSALIANDPLLNAIGTGREVWKGISPDDYVNELRDAWGDRP